MYARSCLFRSLRLDGHNAVIKFAEDAHLDAHGPRFWGPVTFDVCMDLAAACYSWMTPMALDAVSLFARRGLLLIVVFSISPVRPSPVRVVTYTLLLLDQTSRI